VAKINQAKARELRHQGTPAASVSRGTDRVGDLRARIWDAYFANDHKQVENLMAQLKRESPYHSREMYDELNEMIGYGE
jgi:hypothetical protein